MAQWHCTANGIKYGPIELNELRKWIAEGRVRPSDLVWTEGMADWQPVSGVPELGGAALAQPAPLPMPPGSMAAVLPNAPGAVGGMVCGIIAAALGIMCIGTIFCVVLGIVAIFQAKSARQQIAANPLVYGGRGMATAGLVLGIIGLCLGVLDVLYFLCIILAAVAARHPSL